MMAEITVFPSVGYDARFTPEFLEWLTKTVNELRSTFQEAAEFCEKRGPQQVGSPETLEYIDVEIGPVDDAPGKFTYFNVSKVGTQISNAIGQFEGDLPVIIGTFEFAEAKPE